MKSAIDLDHLAIRLGHSPVNVNNRELVSGRRWTLLQAIAWIATEAASFVEWVGSWTPINNALPHPNSARGAGLELAKWLKSLSGVLSLPAAQLKLFRLLETGSVLIYVEHVEYIPAGIRFTNLTYTADFTGLHPAPDERYWGYVVVDAESLREAAAAVGPSPTSTASVIATSVETHVALPATREAVIEIIDKCVVDRLGVEPTRRAISKAFPNNRPLSRDRVRALHAERWESYHGDAPSRGANSRI